MSPSYKITLLDRRDIKQREIKMLLLKSISRIFKE